MLKRGGTETAFTNARTTGRLHLEVYRRLSEAIIDHEYRPGETVAISEMARRLGVSRTPVREALNLLERDHLVRMVGKQGVLVLEMTIDETIHIVQLREVIDGLAARLAANHMSEETLESFRRRFHALAGTIRPDPDAQARLSRELHHAIVNEAGNPYLVTQYQSLDAAFSRTNRRGWQIWKQSRQRDDLSRRRIDEHLAILDAISRRDPQLAEEAARRHLSHSLSDFLAVINDSIPSSHVPRRADANAPPVTQDNEAALEHHRLPWAVIRESSRRRESVFRVSK